MCAACPFPALPISDLAYAYSAHRRCARVAGATPRETLHDVAGVPIVRAPLALVFVAGMNAGVARGEGLHDARGRDDAPAPNVPFRDDAARRDGGTPVHYVRGGNVHAPAPDSARREQGHKTVTGSHTRTGSRTRTDHTDRAAAIRNKVRHSRRARARRRRSRLRDHKKGRCGEEWACGGAPARAGTKWTRPGTRHLPDSIADQSSLTPDNNHKRPATSAGPGSNRWRAAGRAETVNKNNGHSGQAFLTRRHHGAPPTSPNADVIGFHEGLGEAEFEVRCSPSVVRSVAHGETAVRKLEHCG